MTDRPDRNAPGRRRRDPDRWDPGDLEALPRWVIDALTRVTPRDDAPAALALLNRAGAALAEGDFGTALELARRAKQKSPRDATIREVIGIAAYRLGEWEEALRELRTYRRLAGDDVHLPVEIDVLRALDRPDAIADGLAVVIVAASLIVARQKPTTEKMSAYECGFEPFEDSRGRFDVRFYLVAILFIIFDLEIAFLFPWAVSLGSDIGVWARLLATMMIFLGVLVPSVFIYEWKKGSVWIGSRARWPETGHSPRTR